MDLPYVAVLWNPLDPHELLDAVQVLQELRGLRWHEAMMRPGLAVYTLKPRVPYLDAYPLHGGKGMILGVLFDRKRNCRLSLREIAQDPALSETCLSSRGAHLTRHYWGGYVALLSDEHTGDWHVIRDCSGMIPCYYAKVRAVTAVASDMRGFLALGPLRDARGKLLSLDVNWTYLAGFIANSQMQIRETGLKSVHELLAGESLHGVRGRESVELAWSPERFADRDPGDSLEDCCAALRETVQTCIDAWAALHDWVIHSLSGGFDSSLVLSLLHRSAPRPHVVCVNRFASGPAEDERHFARIAASAADAPLIEWPWSFGEARLDDTSIALPPSAKPSISALGSSLEVPFFNALSAAHPFDSIWTGEGGDHLFVAWKTEWPITDFLRLRGLGKGLLGALMDTSKLTGRSVPHLALDNVLSQPRRRAQRERPIRQCDLLLRSSPYRRGLNEYSRHPWSAVTDHLPPGKRHQIMLLADVLNRQRPLPDTQEAVELHPLLSQPVIERCLRIPTYLLLHGGRTRGLARKAFEADLPPEILQRELKGQTTHHALGLVHRSRPFIAEMLNRGVLMTHGILDPAALRPLTIPQTSLSAEAIFPLLAAVVAEAWARSWLGMDRHAQCVAPAAPPI